MAKDDPFYILHEAWKCAQTLRKKHGRLSVPANTKKVILKSGNFPVTEDESSIFLHEIWKRFQTPLDEHGNKPTRLHVRDKSKSFGKPEPVIDCFDKCLRSEQDWNIIVLDREAPSISTSLNNKKASEKKERPNKNDLSLILGTMAHVVMKIDNIDEEAAIARVKDFLKDELKTQSFKSVTDIDEYTDMKKLKKKTGTANRSSNETLLLRAAVVAGQCCCQNKMSTKELKDAFGDTAYKSATKLKKELGLSNGRH